MGKISIVINTLNEEKNLPRVLESVNKFADEIVVCDMYSEDKTAEIAKKLGAKVFFHKKTDYVEPARNFALQQASGDWILVLDADEEVPPILANQLKKIVQEDKIDYVLIPRKNLIFGKWIEHSRWWPDYLVRFFKKGKVVWSDKIHKPPKTTGKELKLAANEENAIIHYNYISVDQYLERMMRYSRIQAEQLLKEGYQFSWQDLIRKPVGEFLSRFFVGEGYKDGIHGLVLGLFQAISEFVVYVHLWESQNFNEEKTEGVFEEIDKAVGEVDYWVAQKTKNPIKKFLLKFK